MPKKVINIPNINSIRNNNNNLKNNFDNKNKPLMTPSMKNIDNDEVNAIVDVNIHDVLQIDNNNNNSDSKTPKFKSNNTPKFTSKQTD